jgi:hypothetical protein
LLIRHAHARHLQVILSTPTTKCIQRLGKDSPDSSSKINSRTWATVGDAFYGAARMQCVLSTAGAAYTVAKS